MEARPEACAEGIAGIDVRLAIAGTTVELGVFAVESPDPGVLVVSVAVVVEGPFKNASASIVDDPADKNEVSIRISEG